MEAETETASPQIKTGRILALFAWFRSLISKNESVSEDDLLEPLMPVADRGTYQRYAPAFRTIIEKDVSCVAITGPYGAGKTSLINTFREEYPKLQFIRISLATFEGDDKESISSHRIERSILQQLIYSTGRKQLQYSRFKKIRKPKWLRAKAILLSLFAILTGTAIKYWDTFEKVFAETNRWQEFAIAGAFGIFWLALLILIVHGVLKTTAGVSIKKLSLKNAEIETADNSEESVFNRHMDEIVYFFQETSCDIVIIEDLDRFEKTEIFTKIREINQLINENPDVRLHKKKPIVFLFAIRDDLFKGKDRTKFFDLLIPVIPFISAGNAYDVLHNKLKKAGLWQELQDKFLRQVTIYVTDNRHLVNIVNEYYLYRRNLFDSNLDPNKMFAIVLYKVFFPGDFGKLHMNEGVLADLVGKLQIKRQANRKEINQELERINEANKQIQQGQIQSREALVSAYVGAIYRRYRKSIKGFQSPNGGEIVDIYGKSEAVLSALQKESKIHGIDVQNRRLDLVSVADLEQIIHPGRSLEVRLREIDSFAKLEDEGIVARRTAITKQLRDARYLPLKDAFSAEEIREEISSMEHGELLVYLVAEGYIGEDYDDYTSYFHKGATTRSDREFVQRFNRDDEIDFSEKIDTPSEILLILEDGLFGKPQGFNITMVDYVLGLAEQKHQSRLVEGFKAFTKEAFRFLEAYYTEGKLPDDVLRILLHEWDEFPEAAASYENPLPHVKKILEKAPEAKIAAMNQPSKLTEFIEASAPDVFDCPSLVKQLSLLAKSGILIKDIHFPGLKDDDRADAIRHVAEHAIWKITPKNVATILTWQNVEAQKAQSEMFLSLENAPPTVAEHVKEHINSFVKSCFLKVDSTAEEPQEGVEHLLSVHGLEEDLGERVIARQKSRIRFSNTPSHYWAAIIKSKKFVIEWQNIEYLFNEKGDFLHVAPIFLSPDTVAELANERKEISADLFGLLVDFDEIELESYKMLIGADLGKITEFPENIEHEKRLHLIRSGMIELSDSAFAWLQGCSALRVALIEKQFATFEKDIDQWPLEEEDLAGLLKSRIPPDAKKRILLNAKAIECSEDEILLKQVVNILTCPDTVIEDFDDHFVEKVIGDSPKCDAVKLLVRMIPKWDEVPVMSLLETIGPPYKKIADYGKRPKIAKNKANLDLVEALEKRGFISQFKTEKENIQIITKRNEPS